jgi:hypothetical protein
MVQETMAKQEKIKARAYEIYVMDGNSPGKDLDHWLQAEKEVLQETKQQKPQEETAKKTSRIRQNGKYPSGN